MRPRLTSPALLLAAGILIGCGHGTTENAAVPPPPGVGGSLGGRRPFPAGNPWNLDVSAAAVDPNSATLIASCGAGASLHPDFGTVYQGAPNGIPYVLVAGGIPRVPITFQYADESDPGPYPIPPGSPVEGGLSSGGDRHVLVVDTSAWVLYELFKAVPKSNWTRWTAGSGAVFDLSSNGLRPDGWTSADAAGLPIFPGLVRYDEVAGLGVIDHALRFTCPSTRSAHIPPARHSAGDGNVASLPPMGMRVRLKAGVDISGYPADARVILTALKKYGMYLADNGSAFFLSGAPDARWNDDSLATMRGIKGSDFEVLAVGAVTVP
jgi:hypothetical protein